MTIPSSNPSALITHLISPVCFISSKLVSGFRSNVTLRNLLTFFPFQGQCQADTIVLLNYWYPLYLCSKRWCRQLRQHKSLWQSTGFKPFGSILPKCSRTLTKFILDLLQLEGLSSPICSILWETQRHFNINILTWFQISPGSRSHQVQDLHQGRHTRHCLA